MSPPMTYSPTQLARQFAFVREAATQNTGQRVEAIQRWSGGSPGQSWCAFFATMIIDLAFQGAAPIPRCGACEDIRQLAEREGWLTDAPAVDDLFLYLDANGRAEHVGIVTQLAPLTGIAGNTSADGHSVNGDGVHEHAIAAHVYVHYPRDP